MTTAAPDTAKRRRRWLQFSLRIVAIVGVVGWLTLVAYLGSAGI